MENEFSGTQVIGDSVRKQVMNFKLQLTDERTTWWEEHNHPEVDNPEGARIFGKNLVERFNASLRPGERPRRLLRVGRRVWQAGQGGVRMEHDWDKTNMVTISKGGRYYDTCRCSRCGCTGKRFVIGGLPVRDKKFSTKKWEFCNPK